MCSHGKQDSIDGTITCKITGLLCHMCIHVMEGVGLHDTFTVVNTVHLELVLMEAVCMYCSLLKGARI